MTNHKVPSAKGPYATTVRAGDVLYLSGQGAVDPETGEAVLGDIKQQTTLTMQNVEALLESEGFSIEDLAQVTCYLTDINDWAEMNVAYGEFLNGRAKPVRTAVAVKDLPFGLSVEITCVAHRR